MTKEHNINDEPPHAVATTRFTTELKKNPHIAVKKNCKYWWWWETMAWWDPKASSGRNMKNEVTWSHVAFLGFEGQGEPLAYSLRGPLQDRWVLIVFSWAGGRKCQPPSIRWRRGHLHVRPCGGHHTTITQPPRASQTRRKCDKTVWRHETQHQCLERTHNGLWGPDPYPLRTLISHQDHTHRMHYGECVCVSV